MGPFVWNSNQNTPQLPPYSLYIKGGVATPNLDMMGFDLRKWTKELLDYLHVYTWDEYCQGAFDPCAWVTIPTCGSTDPLHIYNYGSGGVTISTSGCTWTFDEDCNLTLPGSLYFPDGSYLSSATDLGTINISDGSTLLTGVKTIYFSGATVSGTAPNGDVSINLPSLPSLLPTISGGTGISSYTLGDTLYGNNSNSLSKLTGNTTAIQKFLTQTGTGSVSAAPVWFDLFNTTNTWVTQYFTAPSQPFNYAPSTFVGYDNNVGVNQNKGLIKIYGISNSGGSNYNVDTKVLYELGPEEYISSTTIGGAIGSAVTFSNFGGYAVAWSGGLNSGYKLPLFTFANRELGGTGYTATVPLYQLRASRISAQHTGGIEVVVPNNSFVTGSTVAERYYIFEFSVNYPYKQYSIKQSFAQSDATSDMVVPTALVHLGPGTISASTAPLKFATSSSGGTAAALLNTPEQGAMEVNANAELLYSTNTTADSRGFVEVARYTAVLTTYQITSDDYTIDCTGGGTFNVTLPTAVGIQGRIYKIKNSGVGTITVATTSSQTIDGVTTKTLSTQYQVITVQSTGANWIVI